MNTDRLENRAWVIGEPGQRPVGLVQAAVAVPVEEALQRGGKGSTLDAERIGPRDVGELDQIDSLLCADRSLASRKMTIQKTLERKANLGADPSQRHLEEEHAAQEQDHVEPFGASPIPFAQTHPDRFV
jgi:hypothetical protein